MSTVFIYVAYCFTVHFTYSYYRIRGSYYHIIYLCILHLLMHANDETVTQCVLN